MHATTTVSIKDQSPPAAPLAFLGRQIVRTGTWLKVARIHDEVWQENPLAEPSSTIEAVRTSDLGADLFTFSQLLPDIAPHHPYHTSCDNLAVADTTNFTAWWESLPQESRKNTRKCQKRGVTLRAVTLDDTLVCGIKAIYDEAAFRQGRRFWHYGKDLATVQRDNASYLERAQFIGAYLDEKLIGFMKLVFVGRGARIMQILSMNAHHDKHVMNALLSFAVELCSKRPVEHLIYGQYIYGNKRNSSVTEFKRRNGFHEILLPRYYIPFTWRGTVALSSGLYRSLHELLPETVINAMLGARNFAYKRFRTA